MIQAEIITSFRRFTFDVPAEHAESVAKAHKWLETQIYGLNDGCILLPNRVIDIRQPDDVRVIEVWEVDATPGAKDLINMTSLQVASTSELIGQVDYLENKLQLRLLTYTLRDYIYVLPHEVNDGPALEALGPVKLGALTDQLLQQEGIAATIVIPPVQLSTDAEAQAYVMDYAEEATPPVHFSPSDKTARALGGLWNAK
ncbi:hypothetical protein [Paenibacillus agilis]|uniref:Uncharacterized protein n=1 Tax=Paenibacillus agilis TaxID=3020863 RepID=A0A559IXA5_9BACL|nr:hypothetical protein [Paenibacillus agilis]TVX92267.1 hypothetical protein FPZ44_03830 [Paenibacillus agilis]